MRTAFVSHTIQREYRGKPLRMVVQGLSWPEDRGEWLPLVAGRALGAAHFEMIADKMLGLKLGDRVPLGQRRIYRGRNNCRDVGYFWRRYGIFSRCRTPWPFSSTPQLKQFAWSVLRVARGVASRISAITFPLWSKELNRPLPIWQPLPDPLPVRVLVQLRPGTHPSAVAAVISGWADVTAYTAEQQRHLLLSGMVDRSRRQLGLFRTLLVTISAVIMALILYTLTLDKIHDIAMLKLMGRAIPVIRGAHSAAGAHSRRGRVRAGILPGQALVSAVSQAGRAHHGQASRGLP